MNIQAMPSRRFVRKTQLEPNEYRKNFQQIDREIISVITSPEADRVTPLMSKIYLRMTNAPGHYWEREGVLRIEAEIRGEKLSKAWTVLCELLGVASATANKALKWMHEQGIIGYFSGKNGVGIRIFLNRAVSSIGVRQVQGNKNFLAFPPASPRVVVASANEAAFKDSYAVSESLDKDINSGASKNGAEEPQADKKFSEPDTAALERYPTPVLVEKRPQSSTSKDSTPHASPLSTLEEMVRRLKAELVPVVDAAARRAAAQEHERTRAWLENRGLPKAARVAQHETYNVLRNYGLVSEAARRPRAQAEGGRVEHVRAATHPLAVEEIAELAEACIAMLEAKGQAIERTLSEMAVAAGGFLLPDDAVKVREKTESLLAVSDGREGK